MKMNRGKKLIVLGSAVLILAGAAVLTAKLSARANTAEETAGTVICAIPEDSAETISWSYNGERVTLEKQDDTWQDAEDSSFPLDESYVTTMLSVVESITSSKTIENPDDLAQYGLDEPGGVVTITQSDSTQTTLSFGDLTALTGEQYCSIGDGNVYLVDTSISQAFGCGLYDLVEKETLPDMEDLNAFTVVTADRTMTLSYLENSGLAYSDDYAWFLKDGSDYTALDTSLTRSFCETVTDMTLGSCVCYNADESDLADYGLDAPIVTVNVSYADSDGAACTWILHCADGYCRIGDSCMVYALDSDTLDTLEYTTQDDLLPDEVLSLDWSRVTSVDVSMNGETWTLNQITREVTPDETEDSAAENEETAEDSSEEVAETETVWQLDGEDIDIGDLFESLNSMASSGYATGMSPEHTAVFSFTIHRAQENWQTVTLTFYNYNSTSCLVQLNDESTVLVDRESVTSLTEELSALLLGD